MDNQNFITMSPEIRRAAYSKAFSVLSDADGAGDVAQEVLLRMWTARGKIEDSRCLGFATTLSRNMSLNLLRTRRRHPSAAILAHDGDDGDAICIPDFLSSEYTPHSALEDSENQEIFGKAMQMLPYNWRAVLRMRNIEEMSFEQIAQVMGTTESSVRGLLSKARMQMLQNISKLRK